MESINTVMYWKANTSLSNVLSDWHNKPVKSVYIFLSFLAPPNILLDTASSETLKDEHQYSATGSPQDNQEKASQILPLLDAQSGSFDGGTSCKTFIIHDNLSDEKLIR